MYLFRFLYSKKLKFQTQLGLRSLAEFGTKEKEHKKCRVIIFFSIFYRLGTFRSFCSRWSSSFQSRRARRHDRLFRREKVSLCETLVSLFVVVYLFVIVFCWSIISSRKSELIICVKYKVCCCCYLLFIVYHESWLKQLRFQWLITNLVNF